MDNKLTKRRFSDFISYEWILMIFVSAIMIIVWEFAYTVGSVRLTVGQEFKYYYDQTISSATSEDFYSLITGEDTFSYDVIELGYEALMADYNVLSVRLSIQEGDVLITDSKAPEDGATGDARLIRAKSAVDNFEYNIYCLDTLLEDAQNYLKQFLKDGVTGDNPELNYENLDGEKIKSVFLERMKKDNRFRKEEEKAAGVELEKGRIEKLVKEVGDFKKFLDTATEEAFFKYTKYGQTLEYAEKDADKEAFQKHYQREIDEGRENARYGINAAALKGGANDASTFFKMKDSDTADNVVLMAFNFKEYQPHLQFEVISFFNTVIRACSDII